jgi:hypothetical protein
VAGQGRRCVALGRSACKTRRQVRAYLSDVEQRCIPAGPPGACAAFVHDGRGVHGHRPEFDVRRVHSQNQISLSQLCTEGVGSSRSSRT